MQKPGNPRQQRIKHGDVWQEIIYGSEFKEQVNRRSKNRGTDKNWASRPEASFIKRAYAQI